MACNLVISRSRVELINYKLPLLENLQRTVTMMHLFWHV